LTKESSQEDVLLLRTAPFRSISAANAASRLGSRLARKQPLESARYYWRIYMTLGMGRGSFIDPTANLRVPAWVHLYRSRGLVAAGKLDEALAEGRLALEYLPEEGDVVINLVRALDRAKRKSEADRLFDSMFPRLQRACDGAPKSAECHNRLAWLSARCKRQLDRGLKHARMATTLAPEAANFLDTLAEIHFQRGEKSKAIAAAKKAVKFAPTNPYFAAALKRIEAGDPDADLPEQAP
jgi:tetratricopeptide (TPR) repeat protein